MQLRTDERVIDGRRFYTTSFPVLEALPMWAAIGKLVAPAAARMRNADSLKIAETINRITKAEDIDVALAGDIIGAFGPALMAFFQAVDPAELRALVRTMLSSTTAIVDGASIRMNDELAVHAVLGDNIGLMVKLAIWVGRHNFKGFRSAPPVGNGGAPAADKR